MRATYRSRVGHIAGSKLTSDAGWGCMLRTAQSMLAHAWQRHLQGSAWVSAESANPLAEEAIADLIADLPHAECVYGLHAAARVAASLHGMAPGDWYGPMAICTTLEALNTHHVMQGHAPLLLHVVRDGSLCLDRVTALATHAPDTPSTTPEAEALPTPPPL